MGSETIHGKAQANFWGGAQHLCVDVKARCAFESDNLMENVFLLFATFHARIYYIIKVRTLFRERTTLTVTFHA